MCCGLRVLIAILIAASALIAQTPSLVRDINTIHDIGNSDPSDYAQIGNRTFFSASDPNFGRELWVTDGTTAGTVLFKDICAGNCSSNPKNLINFNGTLFFSIQELPADFQLVTKGPELWKSDGTPDGTVLVKALCPAELNCNVSDFTVVNGILFFVLDSPLSRPQLWKSDGTTQGTMLVMQITASNLTSLNGTLFFLDRVSFDPFSQLGLWKSDGTPNGTVQIKASTPNGCAPCTDFNDLTNVNGTLFFRAVDGLWKSDGTINGTVLVTNVPSQMFSLTNFNGTLFFFNEILISTSPPQVTNQLWKSDGTANGTVMVKDAIGIPGPSLAGNVIVVGTTLFFTVADGANGINLWKSDGTSNGTVVVQNVCPNCVSRSFFPANANGTLFLSATDGVHDGLWKSDGTPAGTVFLKALSMQNDFNMNGTLLFSADDGINGRELWKSDGTTNGTVLVKNISVDMSSFPELLTDVNGTLFFRVTDGTNGVELWKSDNTLGGTLMVKDICPGSCSSQPDLLTNVNGELFFKADDGTHHEQLWKSNGSANGTVLVKDFCLEHFCFPLAEFTNVNGTLFFAADDGAHNGLQLWKSDGTTAGTAIVKADICPGCSADPVYLTNFKGALFFEATVQFIPPPPFAPSVNQPPTAASADQLWKSDGTANGTVMVKDVSACCLTVAKDTLYFRSGFAGEQLWKSDGTTGGTVLVKDFSPESGPQLRAGAPDGTLFFVVQNDFGISELWKSDGTPAGTTLLKTIFINLGSPFMLPSPFLIVNGTLFFAADDGVNGTELWKSDGTPNGTVMVKDICPGFCNSNPSSFIALNGTLFFAATDEVHGIELWKSDGTPDGTVLVDDLNPGAPDSAPGPFTQAAATVFFPARDIAHGRELWSFPLAGFRLSLEQSSLTLNAGQTASVRIDTVSLGGFSGNVAFSCSPLPANSGCTFHPAFVAAGDSTTLTISTSPPNSALTLPPALPFPALPLSACGLIGLITLWTRSRRWRSKTALVPLLLMVALALVSCGGGSKNSNNEGTPAGSYNITVTATSGGVSQNAVFTLHVN